MSSENWAQIFSGVCIWHVKNAAGDCLGQTRSQEEENVPERSGKGGGVWVEQAGDVI